MIESKVNIKDVPPNFPALYKHKSLKYIVLCSSPNSGTVVFDSFSSYPNGAIISLVDDGFLDDNYWERLNKTSTVTLSNKD